MESQMMVRIDYVIDLSNIYDTMIKIQERAFKPSGLL